MMMLQVYCNNWHRVDEVAAAAAAATTCKRVWGNTKRALSKYLVAKSEFFDLLPCWNAFMEIKRSASQLHELPLSLTHSISHSLTHSLSQPWPKAPSKTYCIHMRAPRRPAHSTASGYGKHQAIARSSHTPLYRVVYVQYSIYIWHLSQLYAAIDRCVCFAGNFMACCRYLVFFFFLIHPAIVPPRMRYLCLAISINKRTSHSAIKFSKYIYFNYYNLYANWAINDLRNLDILENLHSSIWLI